MKKLLVLVMALCMVLGLTAGAGAEALPDHPVELELWTDYTISDDIMTKAVEGFNAAYADKGYVVTLNKFPGSQRAELISAAIEADTLPALLFSAWFTTADYVHQGLIEDISDIAATVRDDMYSAAYDACVVDGKSFMIGLYQSYFGMAFNADIFRAAGLDKFIPEDTNEWAVWTMADFETEILPALAAHFQGTEKYPIGLFAGDNQADTFMLNWLSSLGGQMWKDGQSNAGADKNVIAALEKMMGWTAAGYTNSNVITKSGTEVGPDFQNQNSAICSSQVTNYISYLSKFEDGSLERFDLRMACVPVAKDGQDDYLLANYVYGASVVNNGKEDQMAVAREFIKWLLGSHDNMVAINTNAVPWFISITEEVNLDFVTEAAKNADHIWDFTGAVPGYVATRSHLFPALQAAYSGDKSAADALAFYSAEANEIITEYAENSLVLN